MTEAEWLACQDMEPLLDFLRRGLGRSMLARVLSAAGRARKQRLFLVACCRQIWNLLPDPRSRAAVEVAERDAEGLAGRGEMAAARTSADRAHRAVIVPPHKAVGHAAAAAARAAGSLRRAGFEVCERVAALAAQAPALRPARRGPGTVFEGRLRERGRAVQAALVRDIFGNPFRPVALDPTWLTSTVTALAAEMYETRDFSATPILGDALQDAGCDNADILDHCRGPGPHVRGCWAVDLVLGKE